MEESRVTAQKTKSMKIAECLGHPQVASCWFTASVMLCTHNLKTQLSDDILKVATWSLVRSTALSRVQLLSFIFRTLQCWVRRGRLRPIGSEKQFEFIIFVSSILNSLKKVYVTHCINWLNSDRDTRRHKEKQGEIVCDSCVISHMLDCRDRAHKLRCRETLASHPYFSFFEWSFWPSTRSFWLNGWTTVSCSHTNRDFSELDLKRVRCDRPEPRPAAKRSRRKKT